VANWFYTAKPTSYGSPGYPIDGRAIHQGNGKGVLFWETNAQAAKFMTYSDTESADSYWFSDSDLNVPSQGGCALLPNDPTACGNGGGSGLTDAQRRLAANYEYNVTQLEQLDAMNGASKPIVVDVELHCPGPNGCAQIPNFKAAAMHAIIAGARGIIWFDHDFGGNCQTDRIMMDGSDPTSSNYGCVLYGTTTMHDLVVALTAFNGQLSALNDVLLSPFADGYATVTSGVATVMTKQACPSYYVFAGSGKPATPPPANQTVTFKLAAAWSGTVTVVNEGRTLTATNGTFSDTFADADTYHVYQITP
jgi:hypothetical protein